MRSYLPVILPPPHCPSPRRAATRLALQASDPPACVEEANRPPFSHVPPPLPHPLPLSVSNHVLRFSALPLPIHSSNPPVVPSALTTLSRLAPTWTRRPTGGRSAPSSSTFSIPPPHPPFPTPPPLAAHCRWQRALGRRIFQPRERMTGKLGEISPCLSCVLTDNLRASAARHSAPTRLTSARCVCRPRRTRQCPQPAWLPEPSSPMAPARSHRCRRGRCSTHARCPAATRSCCWRCRHATHRRCRSHVAASYSGSRHADHRRRASSTAVGGSLSGPMPHALL